MHRQSLHLRPFVRSNSMPTNQLHKVTQEWKTDSGPQWRTYAAGPKFLKKGGITTRGATVPKLHLEDKRHTQQIHHSTNTVTKKPLKSWSLATLQGAAPDLPIKGLLPLRQTSSCHSSTCFTSSSSFRRLRGNPLPANNHGQHSQPCVSKSRLKLQLSKVSRLPPGPAAQPLS